MDAKKVLEDLKRRFPNEPEYPNVSAFPIVFISSA